MDSCCRMPSSVPRWTKVRLPTDTCLKGETKTDLVYQHQQNSRKIAELQAECRGLDDRLDEIMTGMAGIHKDLITSAKKTSRDPKLLHETVDYEVLLRYAERIAKFSGRAAGSPQSESAGTGPKKNFPWPTVSHLSTRVLLYHGLTRR